MPHITISYRRDDSGVISGRIFDREIAAPRNLTVSMSHR
jgi:hypothetical protein